MPTQLPLERQDIEDRTASGCSCVLPDGAWGTSGWHLMRYTPDMVRRQSEISVAHWGENRELRERLIASYAGLVCQYERCKPYHDAVKAKIAKRWADEKVAGGKKRLLDEED